MAHRTAALPAEVMDTMTAAGIRFLAGPNDFDECLYEIAGRIADAGGDRRGYTALFHAALSGVAAGLAIGKHIERQRLRQTMEQTQKSPHTFHSREL